MRLTKRGERLAAWGILASLLAAMWLASAVGYWLTGVPG
jgi:hypothetical protein